MRVGLLERAVAITAGASEFELFLPDSIAQPAIIGGHLRRLIPGQPEHGCGDMVAGRQHTFASRFEALGEITYMFGPAIEHHVAQRAQVRPAREAVIQHVAVSGCAHHA